MSDDAACAAGGRGFSATPVLEYSLRELTALKPADSAQWPPYMPRFTLAASARAAGRTAGENLIARCGLCVSPCARVTV